MLSPKYYTLGVNTLTGGKNVDFLPLDAVNSFACFIHPGNADCLTLPLNHIFYDLCWLFLLPKP